MGPRTTVFSAPEEVARLVGEQVEFDLPGFDEGKIVPGFIILPDIGPACSVAQIADSRAALIQAECKLIARRLARKLARKKLKEIPQPKPKLLQFRKP